MGVAQNFTEFPGTPQNSIYLQINKNNAENHCNAVVFGVLAEKEGFEPSRQLSHPTPLAGAGFILQNHCKHAIFNLSVRSMLGIEISRGNAPAFLIPESLPCTLPACHPWRPDPQGMPLPCRRRIQACPRRTSWLPRRNQHTSY